MSIRCKCAARRFFPSSNPASDLNAATRRWSFSRPPNPATIPRRFAAASEILSMLLQRPFFGQLLLQLEYAFVERIHRELGLFTFLVLCEHGDSELPLAQALGHARVQVVIRAAPLRRPGVRSVDDAWRRFGRICLLNV